MNLARTLLAAAALAAAAVLPGCDGQDGADRLRVVAGSEAREVEPLIQEWGRANGVRVEMRYAGSLDIRRELAESGRGIAADAVWPAHGVWVQEAVRAGVLRDDDGVMRSPVVFAVRASAARRLGWDREAPSVAEISAAASGGSLKLGMSSATQSNSGAQAWIGFLHGLSGRADALRPDDLEREDVLDGARRLLSAVRRGSGSSAWLGDFVVDNPRALDALVNYEAVLIRVNQRLAAAGQETFLAVYPRDGLSVADHPLMFVPRPGSPGEDRRRQAFERLRAFLSGPEAQGRIAAAGFRTGRVGLEMPDADPAVFRRDWGIDAARVLPVVRMPAFDVVEQALELWQGGGVRRPSYTIYLYDVSGSMQGSGVEQARAAFAAVLDQSEARARMIHAGPRDRAKIVPFSHVLHAARDVRGNDPAAWRDALAWVRSLNPNGGTDFYSPLPALLAEAERARVDGYLASIVILTDGQGDGRGRAAAEAALRRRPPGENVPVFGILFGAADATQLNGLAALSGGRVFDGRRDLSRAFRDVRGYN